LLFPNADPSANLACHRRPCRPPWHVAIGPGRLAGLDPTTFNKSKRGAANGKLRWPSTESLAKVLAATESSLDAFVTW